MKKIAVIFFAFLLLSCSDNPKNKAQETKEKTTQKEESNLSKIEMLSEIEQLASDFKFTEGPAVDAKGNVYFTDIPEAKIYIWTVDNQLETFRENSGGANGLYFDADQNLLACEGWEGQISSTSPNGDYKVIASQYQEKRFNQPNDIWPDAKGGAYFTDPEYNEKPDLPQGGMHVYYIHPNHKDVIRVTDDLARPNGLIGSADGKTLYITDHGANKTYRYNIQEDGTLADKKLFVDFGGDGMALDENGNVYLTTTDKKAVDIISPKGELINSIAVPEQPANVCFGGKNNDELFVTARTSLYKVKLNTKGIN